VDPADAVREDGFDPGAYGVWKNIPRRVPNSFVEAFHFRNVGRFAAKAFSESTEPSGVDRSALPIKYLFAVNHVIWNQGRKNENTAGTEALECGAVPCAGGL
jgi:hypothetical protein